MNELTNKTALVTGASSGIGEAISQQLLDAGCKVIGIGRDFSKSSIDSARFETICLDLADLQGCAPTLKTLCSKHAFDYLVHSAGSGLFGSIEQFSIQQIDNYLRGNLASALMLAHFLVPGMRQGKSGRIVFIGSESSLNAGKKGALYSAAKFGIRGLAQALREDCSKDGITVSLINPGMVRTPFFQQQNFRPGNSPDNAIEAADIARLVMHIVHSNPDMVIDEINLSPRNRSIDFGSK